MLESLFSTNYLIIFIGSIFIGIIGVVFGGSMFLSIPFMQFLFPNLNYGKTIGNIILGSFFRGLASTFETWKKIDLREAIPIIIPFMLSSIGGAIIIAKLDQKYLIYAILSAIFLSEISPKIAHLIKKKTRIIFAIILGIYIGFIGAGVSILLVALLRTAFPKNEQIVFVKIQARFIETIGAISAVSAHLYYGNIIFPLWLIWSAGMFIGGLLGGSILKKTIKINPKVQRIYLIIVYGIAILPFIIKLFF